MSATERWVVSHRTRPLPCQVGLHRPSWVVLRIGAWSSTPYRACAGCGVLLESQRWEAVAATTLVATPLLAAAAALIAGAALRSAHRSRR